MLILTRISALALGVFLTSADSSHLGSNRKEYLTQVPSWLPLDPDFVVITSGLVVIALGISLITTTFIFTKYRKQVGIAVAVFFIIIFPGNINQYVNQIDAFGLDTDQKRLIRLFFQPLLVLWALSGTNVIRLTKKSAKG